jgi:hypothetical protein
MRPTLGRIVHYRGTHGFQAMRAAIVTADVDSLDPRGVAAGVIPALDSDQHVHLWVFTPDSPGVNTEYNVPRGAGIGTEIPPGTWCWPARV